MENFVLLSSAIRANISFYPQGCNFWMEKVLDIGSLVGLQYSTCPTKNGPNMKQFPPEHQGLGMKATESHIENTSISTIYLVMGTIAKQVFHGLQRDTHSWSWVRVPFCEFTLKTSYIICVPFILVSVVMELTSICAPVSKRPRCSYHLSPH